MLIVTPSIVLSLSILSTLMVEAMCSSETSFLEDPQGIASQKTEFFMVAAVKT
jgi:hypothetical protein